MTISEQLHQSKTHKPGVDAMRYEIRVIGSGSYGPSGYTDTLGEVVGVADTLTGALGMASRTADAYYYGVAIVDTQEHTVDWGGKIGIRPMGEVVHATG